MAKDVKIRWKDKSTMYTKGQNHEGRVIGVIDKEGVTHLVVYCDDAKVREISIDEFNG